jgi:hypothetical protein
VIWVDGRRCCYWLLPGQHVPGAEDNELERFLDDFRQLRSRTPLDNDEDYACAPPRPRDPMLERKSATRDPVLAGAPDPDSRERGHEVDAVHKLPVNSGAALPGGQPETLRTSTTEDRFNGAETTDAASGPTSDALAEPPLPPPACETAQVKGETACAGPPPNIPEHARWLWYLGQPLPRAG